MLFFAPFTGATTSLSGSIAWEPSRSVCRNRYGVRCNAPAGLCRRQPRARTGRIQLFGIFKQLFGLAPPTPSAAPAVPRPQEPTELHWPSTGLFPLAAVGASYHEPAIAKLAKNAPGKPALVFCTARLVPENSNPHDPNAVAVWIAGENVGFLPKEFAPHFRGFFARFGLEVAPTTCDAVISNGLLTEEQQYSYTIELDIALEPETAPTPVSPSYPQLSRQDPDPVFRPQEDGSYLVTVRLGPGVLGDMHKHLRMGSWTTDHWSTVNYYVDNPQGIGLGHKLFEVPKTTHQQMFGDAEPETKIVSISRRMATVSLKQAL
jgi:hypothetical protein